MSRGYIKLELFCKLLNFLLQEHIFGYSLKDFELFWTDGVGWKVMRFYFDSKLKKETFSCDCSSAVTS